jgi:hypothetical protein
MTASKLQLVVAAVVLVVGTGWAQNHTDWTIPYDPDANTVELYHFYDGALGGPQDIADYADPYCWGWTILNGGAAGPINVASMPGFGDCIEITDSNDRGEFPPVADGTHNVYTNEVTVEAWINPVAVAGVQRIMHTHGTFSFYLEDANLRLWLFDPAGGNMWFPMTSTDPVVAGQWQHVAGTYSFNPGTSVGTARFYRNGVEIGAAQEMPGALALGNARNVNWQMIGCTSWHADFFNGKIDEVRVSKVARTFTPNSSVNEWPLY